MDPILIALWLTGLVFFVAGLLTYRYVVGGRTRNSWDAPEPRVMEPVEMEAMDAEPQTGLDIWQDLKETMEYYQGEWP